MPVSINDGPPLACRWQVQGSDAAPDDATWTVDVQGEAADLVPLLDLAQARVRFTTPFGIARGQARPTRVVVDIARTPPATGQLTGSGQLRIRPPDPDP